jgi:4-hydroxybenzoyl-CoA reductase subunit beta
MVALGASVTLVGTAGSRTIPASALYLNDGIEYLSKHPDELLTTVTVPALAGARAVYHKIRRRGAFDFPVLGVAAVVRTDRAGVVTSARVVVGGVGSWPVESEVAAAALVGQELTDEAIEAAALAAARPSKPLDNTDFTIGWRKDLVPITVRRALEDLRPPARA